MKIEKSELTPIEYMIEGMMSDLVVCRWKYRHGSYGKFVVYEKSKGGILAGEESEAAIIDNDKIFASRNISNKVLGKIKNIISRYERDGGETLTLVTGCDPSSDDLSDDSISGRI